MNNLVSQYWGYAVVALVLYVLWKFTILLIQRQFGFDVINKLNNYGGGDLRRDRTPGFFGKRGR